MMKKILILFIFLIASCDYQPIYVNKNLKNFVFQKINLEGDISINRKIVNSISLEENSSDEKLNEILISSNFNILETSKNSKGQTETYR